MPAAEEGFLCRNRHQIAPAAAVLDDNCLHAQAFEISFDKVDDILGIAGRVLGPYPDKF
jgi:hypothetical protein